MYTLCFVLINSILWNLLCVWISPVVHTSWLLLRRSWFLSYRWGRWAGRHVLWAGTCCQSAPRCGCRGWGLASVAGCCTAQCSGSMDGTPSRSGTNVPAPAIHKEHQCKNTSCNIITWSSLQYHHLKFNATVPPEVPCYITTWSSLQFHHLKVTAVSPPEVHWHSVTTWSSLQYHNLKFTAVSPPEVHCSVTTWSSLQYHHLKFAAIMQMRNSLSNAGCRIIINSSLIKQMTKITTWSSLLLCKWEIHSPMLVAELSSIVHWESKWQKSPPELHCY